MRIRILLPVALTAILLSACSQNPIGIFESIELEREIFDDRDLANELNVGAIAKSGTRYFIAAGSLYYRNTVDPNYEQNDRAQWAAAPAPGAANENYTTTSLVETDIGGDAIYAVFTSQTGNSQLLRVASGTPGTLGTTVLQSGDPGDSGAAIDSILEVFAIDEAPFGTDDAIVVAVKFTGSDGYGLFRSTDGTTFDEIDGDSTPSARQTLPYVDVIATLTSGVLYVGANGVVLDTNTIAVDGALDDTGVDPGKAGSAVYTGALYDTVGDDAWIADNDGHLYSAADGSVTGAWAKSSQQTVTATSSTILAFTDFGAVPVGFAASSTNLVVGTAGYGYRILGSAGSITAATAGFATPDDDVSNYQASELADAAVTNFFVDPAPVTSYPVPTSAGNPYEDKDGYIFFAGTTNQGLWRALSYEDPVQWVRE